MNKSIEKIMVTSDFIKDKIEYNSKELLNLNINNIVLLEQIIKKNIFIFINLGGLWGCEGIIENFDTQNNLKDLYSDQWLNFINIYITNFIMYITNDWLDSFKNNFYIPKNKIYNHYQWLKKSHNLSLKIGNHLNQGVIGGYFWQYKEKIIYKNNKINIKI